MSAWDGPGWMVQWKQEETPDSAFKVQNVFPDRSIGELGLSRTPIVGLTCKGCMLEGQRLEVKHSSSLGMCVLRGASCSVWASIIMQQAGTTPAR